MLGPFNDLFAAVKDGAVATGAKSYLNDKCQRFGTVTNIEIDSRRKTLRLELALRGETSPIVVSVLSYEVTTTADAAYFMPRQFEASRDWIAAVLNEYVAGRRFQIPVGISAAL